MPIKELPDPPASIHIVGPAMVLVALGVGLGETYMWPRLVVLFGPDIRWLFLIGVTLQAVVMMEMARYALATGESIFFGAARVFQPMMWFFFVLALLTYIWPGHVAGGALALTQIIDVNWVILAIIGLIAIGVVYTFAKVIYNLLESLLSILIGILVIGSAVVAAIVGNPEHLASTISGMFAFGYFPENAHTATWFPVIVGSIAFAGPSGMQQMWYTLYLRDKGAGMGAYIPKIRGLTHASEEETMPSRGFMFDTENAAEMEKWKGWRRWTNYDAIVLFWGITMLVTIVFTVLATAASERNPNVARLLEADEQDAALNAMADAFTAAGGPALGIFFFGFIALVAWKSSLGLFDAFSRGQADITYYFIPGAKRFKMSHIYFMFLWGLIAFGIVTTITMGDSDGPQAILDLLAFLSAFSMGAYCIVLLLVNNILLPKKIRPNMLVNALVAFGAFFYLGANIYSLLQFGAPLD